MGDRLVNSEANAKRIQLVEQCYGNSGQPLALPGRVLIGEGILTKMCRKKLKPRQFFLFNDILVYGKIVINRKKYMSQHILQLESVSLQSIPDDELSGLHNGWQIISPSKSFCVYAATSTEKTEWIAHINRCVQDLTRKRGRKSVPPVEPSPVWIPDSEAPICMHCHKSEFSVINRRHHCRKCGYVCCNACTSKRWLLPMQSSKPLRVCLTCYDALSSPAASRTGAARTSGYGNTHAAGQFGDAEAVGASTNAETSGEDSSDSDGETLSSKSEEPTTFYEKDAQG